MDCRDRFAVWLVELVLEPVRALREDAAAGSVTVRAACGSRRFDVTITRGGGDYAWAFREVAAPGATTPADPLAGEGTQQLEDPEVAFWAAWTAIEASA
jgi:hypothetical protein